MDATSITELLTRLSREDSPQRLEAVSRAEKLPAFMREAEVESILMKPLSTALSESDPFANKQAFMLYVAGGGISFRADDAALLLLRRVERGRRPTDAVNDLKQMLSAKGAEALMVLALWGVTVETPVKYQDISYALR